MSNILDPITSALGSVISVPNTSATASTSQPSIKSKTVSQTASTDSQSTTKTQTKASQSLTSSASTVINSQSSLATSQDFVVTTSDLPAVSSAPTTSILANTTTIQTRSTATSASASSSSDSSITSTTSTDTSTSSTITSAPSTLATSTISSSSSSLPTSSAAASAAPIATNSAADANKVPTAGIVVAAVMGFLILATMLFLIFRYCAPVRRRYDSWQEKKRLARTYREAIDGVPDYADKNGINGSPQPYTGHRFYANDDIYQGARDTRPNGTGLGLGNRLSMLMQHSPFDMGHSNTRPSQIGAAVTNQGTHASYAPVR